MSAPSYDVCIIGLGPAGLGALASLTDRATDLSVVALEAGPPTANKFCTVLNGKGCRKARPCHMIGGIGGASVLSAGKLSGYPAGSSLDYFCGRQTNAKQLIDESLSTFATHVDLVGDGVADTSSHVQRASDYYRDFSYRYYPSYLYDHDSLIGYYDELVSAAKTAGAKILTNATVTSITQEPSRYTVEANINGTHRSTSASSLILATGRQGPTTSGSLTHSLGVDQTPGHIDLGVRLEFPSSDWPNLNNHHNDLKLHFGRARTFCVCSDGFLSPYRWNDILLMEGGTTVANNTGYSNLGIVVRFEESSPGEGLAVLKQIEDRLLDRTGGAPVAQDISSFLSHDDKGSSDTLDRDGATIRYWRQGTVSDLYPNRFRPEIINSVRYFINHTPLRRSSSLRIFGPEIDYFWPQFELETAFRVGKEPCYIVGDRTGHFRGIAQAYSSGQLAARDLRNHIYERRG